MARRDRGRVRWRGGAGARRRGDPALGGAQGGARPSARCLVSCSRAEHGPGALRLSGSGATQTARCSTRPRTPSSRTSPTTSRASGVSRRGTSPARTSSQAPRGGGAHHRARRRARRGADHVPFACVVAADPGSWRSPAPQGSRTTTTPHHGGAAAPARTAGRGSARRDARWTARRMDIRQSDRGRRRKSRSS